MSDDCLAPELLASFLRARPSLTQAKAAEDIGVVPAALNAYLKRKQRPRSETRKRIERWTSGAVPESAWLTAEESVELNETPVAAAPAAVAPDELGDSEQAADQSKATGPEHC